MATLQEFITRNSFEKFTTGVKRLPKEIDYGTIIRNNSTDEGWLYLIVIENDDGPLLITYVGQSTKPINSRMLQHGAGSKVNEDGKARSNKGFSNARYYISFLRKYRDRGYEIYVYCRLSKKVKLLNTEITLCHAEELALLKIIKANGYFQYTLNDRTYINANANRRKWLKQIAKFLKSPSYNLPGGNSSLNYGKVKVL